MGREIGTICSGANEAATRLSGWHPYPAMVPDELAVAMAAEAVLPGGRILDPFCGSGRLLFAASELGGQCVGLDVNPLACLITEAKAANASFDTLNELLIDIQAARECHWEIPDVVLRNTSVPWLAPSVAKELAQIIAWINLLELPHPDLLVIATALSAATRDASWIRKSGWKLHRMSQSDRAASKNSAWTSLARRLAHYIYSSGSKPWTGNVNVHRLRADAATTDTVGRFDAILTSPPYGDSRTTVQYGAASSICLDIVSRLNGLQNLYLPGREIDGACLGSISASSKIPDLKLFWAGAPSGEGCRRVSKFLSDFSTTCRQLSELVEPHGTISMVVGRRSVGGFRVKFDDFAIVEMSKLGFVAERVERRRLRNKSLPRAVNRFGRAIALELRDRGRTKTMDEEIVLMFRRNKVDLSCDHERR